MTLPKFEYFAPQSLDEAHKLLLSHGEGTHLLAGGTDLLVKMNHGLLKPKYVIALKQIKGLDAITFDPKQGLKIGATALLADVAIHPDILEHYPAIAAAAKETANVQIRNMGTVAGNLCNAAPSADNAPTLLAMNAEAVIRGAQGEKRLALEKLFKGPGQTALGPGEIVTAIMVPAPPSDAGVSYQHISARGKVDISAVCVGVMVRMEGDTCRQVNIFLGAVAPVPMRAVKAESVVRGNPLSEDIIQAAGTAASHESQPITDVRSSADYRKKMVAVLTRRALMEARDRALNMRKE